MHTACTVAVIYAWHRAGLKILENMRVLHFTHDRNDRPLEPCLFLRIMVSQSEGQRLLKPK